MRAVYSIIAATLLCAACIDAGNDVTPAAGADMGVGDASPDQSAAGCKAAIDCPKLENTTAVCADAKCVYECQAGFKEPGLDGAGPAGCSCQIAPEVCDDKDNDCDGIKDNLASEPRRCDKQDGVCAGAAKQCPGDAAAYMLACDTADYTAHAASYVENEEDRWLCDMLDNDCDGTVDESCCPQGEDATFPLSGERLLDSPVFPGGLLATCKTGADEVTGFWFDGGAPNRVQARSWSLRDDQLRLAPSGSLPGLATISSLVELGEQQTQLFLLTDNTTITTLGYDHASRAFTSPSKLWSATDEGAGDTILWLSSAPLGAGGVLVWIEEDADTNRHLTKLCIFDMSGLSRCGDKVNHVLINERVKVSPNFPVVLVIKAEQDVVILRHDTDGPVEVARFGVTSRTTTFEVIKDGPSPSALLSAAWLGGDRLGFAYQGLDGLRVATYSFAEDSAGASSIVAGGFDSAALVRSGDAAQLLYSVRNGAIFSLSARALRPETLAPVGSGAQLLATYNPSAQFPSLAVAGVETPRGVVAFHAASLGGAENYLGLLQLNRDAYPICPTC